LVLVHRPPCPFLALLQRTINNNEYRAKFTMTQAPCECELAMTVILQFDDFSDVCRIF
jgi:hypothetical protein